MPFNFFRSKKNKLSLSPVLTKKMDRKLISQTQGGVIPSPRQLKYLGQFLSGQEKRTLSLLITLVIVTGIITGGVFLSTHVQRIPAVGGEYREALIGEPKYINPLFASANDVDSDLVGLLYAGLFRFNDKRELIPDLSASSTMSTDGKTYDITLKSGISWSDGVALTADDIVYTFELLQNPETGSPLYETFQGVEVKKISDTTVRFTLKQAFAPFLQSLTVGILPEHIWQNADKPGNLRLTSNNLQPHVTSGAWKFDHLVKASDGTVQSYILERNENYYGQKPFFKTLAFSFFPDITQATQKIHNQDVDALAFPLRSKNDLLTSRNLTAYKLELSQYTALFFNLQDEVVKDKDLRTALQQGTNKDLIIKEALQDQGVPVQSPILAGMVGYATDTKSLVFNFDAANALLDKQWTRIQPEEYFKLRKDQLTADYANDLKDQLKTTSSSTSSTVATLQQELAAADSQLTDIVHKEMSTEQTFYRKNKKNQVLSLTITCLDTPEQQKVAETIAKEWQLLGIQATIQRVNSDQISREVLRGRNFQILLYGELVGGDPDPYPLWHSSKIDYPGLNFTQFNNRTADKLLEDGRSATTLSARSEAYRKFQEILFTEIPAIFLYTPQYDYVISKNIKNVHIGNLVKPADRFNDLADWYTKMKFVWK